MTDFQYIKFNIEPETAGFKKRNRFWPTVIKTILFFIPRANPEYDNLIGDVAEWQLEIDPNDNLPVREICKDITGKIIMVMPWRDNYGYWTDNNVTKDYFKEHFNASDISQTEFDQNWGSFTKNNSN